MNYFVAATVLKVASANALTRSAYRALAMLRGGPRKAFIVEALWVMEGLPEQRQRLLDLGTGWAHVYSLYPALMRDDELHCFDVTDIRNFRSFVRTVPLVLDQIRQIELEPTIAERVARRAATLMGVKDFDQAYEAIGITYQTSRDGIPNYPSNFFDRIFSIDVLEHVDAATFPAAAAAWYRILKPGGRFVAQVGLDDHLAFYEGKFGSKKYLQYSHKMWDRLLGNNVQYINRLTASQIIVLLEQSGFIIEESKTDDSDMARANLHPDYGDQSDDDIRAVRLFVKAYKPLA